MFDKDSLLLLLSECKSTWGLKQEDFRDIGEMIIQAGFNLKEVMQYFKDLTQNDWELGGHMFCTRINVIPNYEERGKLIEDYDHLKGLIDLVAVDLGYRKPY